MKLRLLSPILGEAFINVVTAILAKPEIRSDDTVWLEYRKKPFHLKLSHIFQDCIGFKHPLDENAEGYVAFQRSRSRRNDDLHANVLPERYALETVFFDDKIPLYAEPGDIFQKFWQNYENLVAPKAVLADYEAMHIFFAEVLQALVPNAREVVETFLETSFLGYNPVTRRFGKIWPNGIAHMSVDIRYDDELIRTSD
jgi:hypothetical protein